MKDPADNLPWWKKIMLKIPGLRHKMARNTVESIDDSVKTTELCNKAISYKTAYTIVKIHNEKVQDIIKLIEPAYFEYVLKQLFGKKSLPYSKGIKIEKAKLSQYPNMKFIVLGLPSNEQIGESEYVGIIIDEDNVAAAYSLEYSMGCKMICSWMDGTHYNFGVATDKVDFVKKVCAIHAPKKPQTSQEPTMDNLDLKHRLAKEIGVRVEMLDFYMAKFQDKVVKERQDIDTSGIDEDIENVDEWMRYCHWEIEQAKKRMSEEDLNVSRDLFNQMAKDRDSN